MESFKVTMSTSKQDIENTLVRILEAQEKLNRYYRGEESMSQKDVDGTIYMINYWNISLRNSI